MKVPKHIKEAIMKCADFNSKANKYEKEVHNWLEENELTEETALDAIRNMDDSFIDCCQVGYCPEHFIKQLEELED